MTQYRRNWSSGGAYFFTVAAANRSSGPLVDQGVYPMDWGGSGDVDRDFGE